jgi:hypothetical protein
VVARVLALLAAAAMVAGSLALRARMDRGDGTSSGGLRITCATELEAVCAARAAADGRILTTVEPAPATAARLISAPGQAGLDVWVAPGPWAELVDEARRRETREAIFARPGPPVARSPLIAVLEKSKADDLRAGPCKDRIGWRCLGEAAGGGSLRIGARPATEAEGVLVRAAAVAGYLGVENFAIHDLTDNLDATAWLAGLEASIDAARSGGATDFRSFLVKRGTANGFLLTEAAAVTALAGAADKERFELVFLHPPATADLVVAEREGAGRLVGRVGGLDDVLRGNGWRVAGRPPVVGIDPAAGPLPPGDGLPSAGVLQALHEVFR